MTMWVFFISSAQEGNVFTLQGAIIGALYSAELLSFSTCLIRLVIAAKLMLTIRRCLNACIQKNRQEDLNETDGSNKENTSVSEPRRAFIDIPGRKSSRWEQTLAPGLAGSVVCSPWLLTQADSMALSSVVGRVSWAFWSSSGLL